MASLLNTSITGNLNVSGSISTGTSTATSTISKVTLSNGKISASTLDVSGSTALKGGATLTGALSLPDTSYINFAKSNSHAALNIRAIYARRFYAASRFSTSYTYKITLTSSYFNNTNSSYEIIPVIATDGGYAYITNVTRPTLKQPGSVSFNVSADSAYVYLILIQTRNSQYQSVNTNNYNAIPM